MADLSNGGCGPGARTSIASTRPRAFEIGMDSAGSGDTERSTRRRNASSEVLLMRDWKVEPFLFIGHERRDALQIIGCIDIDQRTALRINCRTLLFRYDPRSHTLEQFVRSDFP